MTKREILASGALIGILVGIGCDVWYQNSNHKIIYEAEAAEPREVLIGVKIDWTEERIERAIRETFPEMPNTMLAVAKCESGLNQEAKSHTNDFGLMQINEASWHQVALELNLDYKSSIEDNLKMARHIFEVQGVTAWVCFNKGLHKKYL